MSPDPRRSRCGKPDRHRAASVPWGLRADCEARHDRESVPACAYARALSDGMRINIRVDSPGALAKYEAGKNLFFRRIGQLDAACTGCIGTTPAKSCARFAKVHNSKIPVTACELLYERVLPFYDALDVPVQAILTYNGWSLGKHDSHPYELLLPWRHRASTQATRQRSRERMSRTRSTARVPGLHAPPHRLTEGRGH